MFPSLVATLAIAAAYLGAASAAPAAAQFTGDATWFNPATGACGRFNTDNDLVVALSPSEYSGGARCFQNIQATYQGKSVVATVVDLCPGCGSGSIDLSPAAFQRLASLDVGRIHGVTWNFQ
ncbi:hypothetical protein K474DRAFT_1712396 [Panus rudis PR-1116 ss-1]|nr:hypothetical protein K474DRAFT_1712396 [Panus rudis PR-1116 ss-1]